MLFTVAVIVVMTIIGCAGIIAVASIKPDPENYIDADRVRREAQAASDVYTDTLMGIPIDSLEEIARYCAERDCYQCRLFCDRGPKEKGCCFGGAPCEWKFAALRGGGGNGPGPVGLYPEDGGGDNRPNLSRN